MDVCKAQPYSIRRTPASRILSPGSPPQQDCYIIIVLTTLRPEASLWRGSLACCLFIVELHGGSPAAHYDAQCLSQWLNHAARQLKGLPSLLLPSAALFAADSAKAAVVMVAIQLMINNESITFFMPWIALSSRIPAHSSLSIASAGHLSTSRGILLPSCSGSASSLLMMAWCSTKISLGQGEFTDIFSRLNIPKQKESKALKHTLYPLLCAEAWSVHVLFANANPGQNLEYCLLSYQCFCNSI